MLVRLTTIEYIAAVCLAVWSLWVLVWGPGQSLSAPAFADLREVAVSQGFEPWRFYGLLGLSVAGAYAAAIWVNGASLIWTPIVRWAATLMMSAFFAQIAAGVFSQQPSSTAVATYGLISGLFGLLFLAHRHRVAAAILLIWGRLRAGVW